MSEYINILDLCETGSKELGPGNRYIIWTQGCPFHCLGCISPEGQPIIENKLIEIDKIIHSICINPAITGITISGGEPFLQASKLIKILAGVKLQRPDIDVIVFSGFQLEELDWIEAKEMILFIDVLIDGKYKHDLNDNKGLRGSSNQRIHFLTDRLKSYVRFFKEKNRGIELHISIEQQVAIGIPNKNTLI